MNIRRSLEISVVLALFAAPAMVGCAADSTLPEDAPEDAPEDVGTQESGLSKQRDAVAALDLDAKVPSFPEVDVPDPAAPLVRETSAGDGWRVLHVTGTLPEATSGAATAIDDDIIVLEHKEAVATAPLGPKTRADLLVSSTLLSKSATPGLAASDDTTMFTVVHKKTMDAAEAAPEPQGGATYFSFCSNYDGQFVRSASVDRAYSFHKGDEAGSFTGAFDVDARLKGSASATVKYRAKTSILAGCKAVWIDFKKAILKGNASVTSTGAVDATIQKEWHFKRTVANPKLLDQWFSIGIVPVHLRIFAPVEVGLDAAAKATLKASAKVEAKASFDITCGTSSCSGARSATVAFVENQPPTFEAQAKVNVTPWAQGSLKAVLFDETVGGWGQVGVRASLPTDLFAYAGNTCGDADGDGTSEFVTAATLDMSAKVDVIAKAGAFGAAWGPWTWNVVNEPVAFKSFGEGSALDPILYDEPSGAPLKARMRGRMRPCVPFTDTVTYRITWSDGAVTTFHGEPGTLFTKEHQFATAGVKPVKLEALRDARGRTLGGATTHDVAFRRWLDTQVGNVPGMVLAR